MMPTRNVDVVVIHDNFITCAGLVATFEACADMNVRRLAPDGIRELSGDVVVADPRSGAEVLRLNQDLPTGTRRPKVAIVSSSDREWQIRDALARGASAYVLLGSTGEELVRAVRAVHAGGCHLSPTIAAKLAESLNAEPLTARELDVLALLTDGLCNKRIAARLDISVGTVKTHLRSTYEKLRVSSRIAAVAAAERRGILKRNPTPDEVRALEPPALAMPLGGRVRAPLVDHVGGRPVQVLRI